MSLPRSIGLFLFAALTLIVSPRRAHAQACSTLPNPIYIGGSSAIGPFIQAMGTALAKQANPAATLIYQSAGSCVGVNAIVNDTNTMMPCAMGGSCITGNATYYDNTGAARMCTLDANGTHLDVGVSDVFVKTCTGQAPPAGIADILGPAQAMAFVVPAASSQTALVAEEGYFVFGFGKNGQAMPWVDETLLFIRNAGSGTQNIIANAIGVLPAAKMKGIDSKGSGGVLQNVSTSTTPEATIGIIAAEFYDKHRDVLKALAFRAFKQQFAFFPDSTATAFDKKNVRDGHYLPFGYLHLIAAADNANVPTRPGAKQFVRWVFGQDMGPWGDILDVQIDARVIPQCAMTVQRSAEGGDLSLYKSDTPCGCYFENRAATMTACKVCQNDNDCGAGKCRRGFCEAR